MKIVIFGATGKVGRNLTAQALQEGHEVTAFVRKQSADLGQHPNLALHIGDVLKPESIKAAIEGQDAVLIALGAPLRNKDKIRTRGTKAIIAAMQAEGVKRLICLSGFGAGESYPQLPRLYRWLIMPLVLKHVYADHEEQENLVKQSNLDWTLVRPTNLMDGPKTDTYKVDFQRVEKDMIFKITFKDVAGFMLQQLTSKQYCRAAASLSS